MVIARKYQIKEGSYLPSNQSTQHNQGTNNGWVGNISDCKYSNPRSPTKSPLGLDLFLAMWILKHVKYSYVTI